MYKIHQKPFFGHGLGTYFIAIPQISFQQTDPNNIFLLNWHNLGLVGMTLFTIIVAYLLWTGLMSLRSPSSSTLRMLYVAMFAGMMHS